MRSTVAPRMRYFGKWEALLSVLCVGGLLAGTSEAFMSPLSLRPTGVTPLSRHTARRSAVLFANTRMSSSAAVNIAGSPIGEDEYKEGILKIQKSNSELLPHFKNIRKQKFFRYYAVDLLSSCTYFPTIEFPCEMAKCDVENAIDVPDDMRERDQREHSFKLDGWVRWDMPGDFTDYYNLEEIPERFTGYDGSKVWSFIHEKICFQQNLEDPANAWKLDYNRALSGLHTSISAHVTKAMELSPEESLKEYKRRIADVPGAVENLYFAYMLMLCAISEAEPRLTNCAYMGTKDQVMPSMSAIVENPILKDIAVQKAAASLRKHASLPTAQVWKARMRTRDLLGIMNCVQCNVCRLHGKVASLGLGVAFQVLLGTDGSVAEAQGRVEKLHRIEVAALLTTAGKFANALAIVAEYEAKLKQAA